MFVFLNSMLQVLQKVYLLKNIVKNKKYRYERNIDMSISVREYMVYYLLLSQRISVYV